MDYEKVLGEHKFPTYEELKTGLLRLIDEGKISREDAARLLPELRESEDERIRKAIALGIKRCADAGSIFGTVINNEGVNYHDVLAWLEKQKEPKPDSLTKYVYSSEDKKFIQDCANILVANDYATSAERLLSMFKQKSAEYKPKAGEDIYHAINGAINLAIDIQRSVSLCFNGVTLNVFPESCISEIVSYYHEQVKDDVQREKPEWSEEDEKMLHSALWHIANSVTNGKLTECKCDITVWLEEKLKSLRTSWKPSEEQMKVMERFVDYLHESGNKDYEIMDSFLEQLKNL